MKKIKAVLSVVVIYAMTLGVLSGCGQKSQHQPENQPAVNTPTESASTESAPATNAPASGDKLNVVFIPKLVGIPWFNQMENGLKEYAQSTGTMNITVSGPVEADPVQQAKVIEDVVATKPDAIIVVPNDTKVLEPILKKAREAGIIVITQEANTVENADADVEFLIMDMVGKQYLEGLAKSMGGEGGYAIMVGGLTVENHNARADAVVAYQKEHYPNMYEVTSRVEGSESVEQSHDKTLELMKAYDDLKGILYIGTNGPLGGAAAIKEKNMVGKFANVGTAIPSQAKPFLKDGAISTSFLGSPHNIGKATAYILDQLVANGMDVNVVKEVPEYGAVSIDGKVITFHSDVEITYENADSFGF